MLQSTQKNPGRREWSSITTAANIPVKMLVRTCYKNIPWLKIFLFVNATLCVYGISRLTSSPELTSPETSSVLQKQYKNNKDLLSHNLLTSPQHKERYRQTEHYSPNCNCSYSQSSDKDNGILLGKAITGKQYPPTKIGDDFDHSKQYQVPNIVHYIWYNTKPAEFQFHHMLAVMSASKTINPDVIYFHTDNEPIGEFWESTKKLPKLKIVKRDPPVHIFGEDVKPPLFYTSHSNVDRLKVLMEYGGIYLDFDVFVTKTFDDLRKHVCTIGFESEEKSCGSVVVCSKHAFFLILWINSYFDDYQIDVWAYNTGMVPFNLANRFPHLVHVEKTKLNRPNFKELNLLYGDKTWNWRDNYAVHTWYRLWKDWSGMFKGIEPNMTNIKTLNNTFGQIARSILFDSSDIIK